MSTVHHPSSGARAAHAITAAALVGGWLAVAALTWPGAATPHHEPNPVPHLPADAAAPLLVGPITFFNTSCGGCHGDYGMLMDEELDDPAAVHETLRRIVRDMVTGQAQTTLPQREIDALAAYRRSLLSDAAPYLAWTSAAGGEVRGEVTPGATLEARAGTAAIPVTLSGHTWAAHTPTPQRPITIRATLRGRSTELHIPAAAFSHDAGR